MAISHSSGIERTRNSSVGIDRLRIDFDSNLRRWFGRNIGLWHSKRQYFFDEEKAINLETVSYTHLTLPTIYSV